MFNYIYESKTHTDTSEDYMLELGMNAETIESVLRQKEYEAGDCVIAKRKAAYALESDPLFLEWQYDKTPESEQRWREKVLEIKEKYPLGAADA
ncbi:MAG: hypothetical protein ACRCWP_03305 [Shewanella sp.]